MKPPDAGRIYWIRRGTKQRQLALILARRGAWVQVRVWFDRPARWSDAQTAPASLVAGEPEPENYYLRRALQFADADLARRLLAPGPEKGRKS